MSTGGKPLGRALVTGAGSPIGRAIATALHAAGYTLVLHYRSGVASVGTLADVLNGSRRDSAQTIQADLGNDAALAGLAREVAAAGPLAVLVNNASAFHPTHFDQPAPDGLRGLMDVNAGAPFYLVQSLSAALQAAGGVVVNITDAAPALVDHEAYALSKLTLEATTGLLARRLAPAVRVNAVAPGAISWPPQWSEVRRQQFAARIPLARLGEPADIAAAVLFLVQAPYVTGQVLAVDGGLRGAAAGQEWEKVE